MNTVDKIVMKSISEIRPYVRNPRKNDKTVKLLVDIIPKVGFNVPILIDKKGVIVKGHARYNAAIKLGMEKVPCVITEADEEAIKLDRIADNKISEFSEWITDELRHEIDMLDISFDLSELGLEAPEMPQMSDFDDFAGWSDSDASEADEAEKSAKMEAYLKMLEEQQAQENLITSQKEIDRAKVAQAEVAPKPIRYYKVVCEHCGHTMFVKEGDLQFEV